MILEKLNGRKLVRVFEWFLCRSSTQLFEFEDSWSVCVGDGDPELFHSYTDMLQFLDKRGLSEYFYQEKFYVKRTALEEYSRQVFGRVQDVYEKYPNIVSADCTECVWKKYHVSEKQCKSCWALKWNSDNPQIIEVINKVT